MDFILTRIDSSDQEGPQQNLDNSLSRIKFLYMIHWNPFSNWEKPRSNRCIVFVILNQMSCNDTHDRYIMVGLVCP